MASKLKIYKPEYPGYAEAPDHEVNCREMMSIWRDEGWVEFSYISGDYIWADKAQTFLIWDRARIDDRSVPPLVTGLFANTVPNHPQIHPWTFFARHPRKLRERVEKGINSYDDRPIHSIFMGKVENQVQANGRLKYDWSTCIEEFAMPVKMGDSGPGGSLVYTQEEYQDRLASSKFGLLLPGYGPKCNRDIECMGHGTVPIVVEGCDVVNYHEPWIEGVHYVGVKTPEEAIDKVSNISKNEWEYMHNACRSWYERNASPLGSFKLTEMLIEKWK
jgi:hypothetical protein